MDRDCSYNKVFYLNGYHLVDEKHLNEAKQHLSTLADCIRFAVSCFNRAELFYGHGTCNAYEEAVSLLMPALYLPPDPKPDILHTRLLPSEKNVLIDLIHRRVVERVPSAYLINKAWFCGLEFYVDERVLIPRSPIGELIKKKFSPYLTSEPERILDLCTGSGCLAIALAQAFPHAEIDALDVSEDALDVAMMNIESYALEEQVTPIQSDLMDALSEYERFDLIVCNPPYVDAQDMDDLPDEFQVEPEIALAAGVDGLDLVHRILLSASEHLTENGLLILEVGNSMIHLEEAYPKINFEWVEFQNGGGGVCVLHAHVLRHHRAAFIDNVDQ